VKTTRQYLAEVKRALEISSDYALAKQLRVTRATMSLLANGHTAMGNTTAARVAEILDLPLARVIADMELERGSNHELWTRIRAAAAVLVGAVAGALLCHALSSSFDITVFREAFVTLACVVSDAGRNTDCMPIVALAALALLGIYRALRWPALCPRPNGF
jgi:plasmid maintenance system antidote protein VapI